MLNDRRIDWSSVVLEPETQKSTGAKQKKGSKSRVPTGAGAARNADDRRRRTAPPAGARVDGLEYVIETLRLRGYVPKPDGDDTAAGGIDDFTTDVDSSVPGAWQTASKEKRLVLWPCVPVCGERTLEKCCAGDPDVIKFCMTLCTLHLDMRIRELITDTAEDPVCAGRRGLRHLELRLAAARGGQS